MKSSASLHSPHPANAVYLGGRTADAAGSETTMVSPPPGASSGSTVPPIASVRPRATTSPTPPAGPVARVAEPVEGQEHPLPVGLGDARAVIDYAQLHRVPTALAVTSGGDAAGEYRRALPTRFATTRSTIAGSAITSPSPGGMSASTDRPRPEAVERVRDELAQIRGPGEDRQPPGLQPAHIQQARREVGEQVEGLLRGGQQLLTVVAGQEDVARAQAGHRRLGRGQRRAQVVADCREQCRPSPVGLGRQAVCRARLRNRTSHQGPACS
jgi:hypothetical protein